MGTYLRVLRESYPMNTTRQGLVGFQKSLHPCALDKSSFSIGRVKGIWECDLLHVARTQDRVTLFKRQAARAK